MGPRLKRLREVRELSREALAARAGVSVRTIKNAETGMGLRAGTLRQIERALAAPEAVPRFAEPVLHPSGQVWRCPRCFNCYCLTVVACPNDGQNSPLRTKPAGNVGDQRAVVPEREVSQEMQRQTYRETQEQMPDRSKADEAAED